MGFPNLCTLSEDIPLSFDVQIRSLGAINGVVTITESGTLYSVNDNFLHELFGYGTGYTTKSLTITDLIPNFFENMGDSGLPESSNSSETEGGRRSRVITDSSTCETQPSTSSGIKKLVHQVESLDVGDEKDPDEVATSTDLSSCGRDSSAHSVQAMNHTYFNDETQRSQSVGEMFQGVEPPREKRDKIQEGMFVGLAKHVDTSLIPVRFEVRTMDILSEPLLYMVCINYNRGIDYGISQFDEMAEEITEREGSFEDDSSTRPHLAKFIIGGKEFSSSGRYSFGSSLGSRMNLRQQSVRSHSSMGKKLDGWHPCVVVQGTAACSF